MKKRFTPLTWTIATLAVLLGTVLAQSASVEAPRLTLSYGQFGLVYQLFSITIATMGAGFLFFVLAQPNLSPKYRPAMVVSALVVAVACYHYFRIFNSWNESYALTGEVYRATGIPFNDAYRYADWILTVPLLLVASWGFYPVAYLLPVLLGGGLSANGVVAVQVGYSLADILAKVGFGTLIYFIALEKTGHDRSAGLPDSSTTPAATD